MSQIWAVPYHQQVGVAHVVGVLDVLLFHVAPLVLPLSVPLPSLLLGLLPGLLLPLKVLSCFQAGQRPPALHLLGTEDGEPRAGPVLGQLNGALRGRLCPTYHVAEI